MTNILSSVYFFPVGNLTLSHLGLGLCDLDCATSVVVDIVNFVLQRYVKSTNYSVNRYHKLKPTKKTIPVQLSLVKKAFGLCVSGVCLPLINTKLAIA